MRGYLISFALGILILSGACSGDDEVSAEADAGADALVGDGGGGGDGEPDAAVDAGAEDAGSDGGWTGLARCGDGHLDYGELCDDGNDQDSDGCSSECRVEEGYRCPVVGADCEQCGNGVVESTEQCDDRNRDNGDGCDDACFIEDGGWVCPVAGQPCELCGNGIVEANEKCDEGDSQDGVGCADDCRSVQPGFSCPVAGEPCVQCGDGSVDGDEACDDGNTDSGDGCVFNCRAIEPGWKCPAGGGACTLCGDGTLQDATEQCDDGNFQSGDGCSALCEIEAGAVCLIPGVLCSVCGNGYIEFTAYRDDDFADPEQCDDGNQEDDDGCNSSCEIEDGGSLVWLCPVPGLGCGLCGDGIVQPIEACDDGVDAVSDLPVSGDGCSADCTVIEQHYICPAGGGACARCGDGVLDAELEECDDGSQCDGGTDDGADCTTDDTACLAGGGTCSTLAGDGCSRMCLIEAGAWVCPEPGLPCELCGNGVVETNEACDDGDTEGGDGCAADCRTVEENYNCYFPGFACALCGNGLVEVGEECDEGHIDAPANATEGCNDLCRIVEPWSCPMAGQPCELCGDGVIDAFESCDDGNNANDDGCDSTCQVELGFDCSGDECVAAACGDGFVAGDEECDDGNLQSGDGCSFVCDVEKGFSCEGALGCRRTECGDGILEGEEQCDDGSQCGGGSDAGSDCTADPASCELGADACVPQAGDGCSDDCTLEMGYKCPAPGLPCEPAECGDGVAEGAEQCDDGSQCDGGSDDGEDCTTDDTACVAGGGSCGPLAGDGCSDDCLLEPGYHCPVDGEPCEPTICGDGLVQGLEACDDGSQCDGGTDDGEDCTTDDTACVAGGGSCGTADGDGCAADCTVENFYRCSGEPSSCRPIIEFVSIRRFTVANVDPAALNYNPDRRSFAGHKSSSSQISIELCLDGTVINQGDTSAGSNGTVYYPDGVTTEELPIDCADATTEDLCYPEPLRPERLPTDNLGGITGSAFDPVTGHFLFLNQLGGTVTLTELPRDIDPNNLPIGFDIVDYQVVLADPVTPGELTVGEDGDLYIADDDAGGLVLVYPRRRDGELNPIWPDCATNGMDPGNNCTSFAATPDAGRGWAAPSVDPLSGIFTVPGEDMIGIFNRYEGALEYTGEDALTNTPIDSFEYFTFYDIYSILDPPLYGRSGLPGLLFLLGNQGTSYVQESKSAETAPDGGAFIVCSVNPSEDCQLFAKACQSDADCPPGTICNLDGIDTVGVPYCHAPGDARDDRYRVDRDAVSEDNPVPLAVLINDSLSESACIDPNIRIVSVCGDGVEQPYEADHPDNCTDEPDPQGTVTWDGDDTIDYDAPDDGSCGFIDTFTYTANLGGNVFDTATVRVLVACVCGDEVIDNNEQCDDGTSDDADSDDILYNGEPGELIDDMGTPEPEDDIYVRCSLSCYWNVFCGDGYIVSPEECDDGNALSGDGCSAVCTLESVCGDGFVEGVEVCDDGSHCTNGDDCTLDYAVCMGIGDESCEPRGGDGCNVNCTEPICGDGNLDLDNPAGAEQCDDGNLAVGDGCDNLCQIEAECGNGVIEPPEQCDDGGKTPGDGCSALCTLENICGNDMVEGVEVCDGDDFGSCPIIDSEQILCVNQPQGAPNICLCQNYCGDGAVGGTEECDDGTEGSDTCRGAAPATGDPCTERRCGDGITEGAEECDDGNTNPADGCTNDCKLLTVCGDGVQEGAEQCDDGNNVSGDGCSSSCKLEVTVCGDGVLDYNEQCDDGNTDSGDGCDENCMIESGQCGNGTIDPGEQCDDGNTNSGDGCDRYCESELCGNGEIDFEEECDDGNNSPGDGCGPTCRVEIE